MLQYMSHGTISIRQSISPCVFRAGLIQIIILQYAQIRQSCAGCFVDCSCSGRTNELVSNKASQSGFKFIDCPSGVITTQKTGSPAAPPHSNYPGPVTPLLQHSLSGVVTKTNEYAKDLTPEQADAAKKVIHEAQQGKNTKVDWVNPYFY